MEPPITAYPNQPQAPKPGSQRPPRNLLSRETSATWKRANVSRSLGLYASNQVVHLR
ncbi:hypothetical protein [Rosistilla oblonga]|uniref:hypothetical protein n=1 Tax=Rosistilla oblonga TaxID=2527990 RepID=UPI003A96E3EF